MTAASSLSLAAVQFNPTVGDIVGNVAKILAAWRDAKARGADLVVTPEMSVTGYSPEDLVRKPDLLAECEDAYRALAAATAGGPPLIVGGPVVENGAVYNAALLIENGYVRQTVKKHDLPNYGVFDDKRLFAPGGWQEPILVKGIPIGLMICEDTWFPDVAQTLKARGAQILLSINGSPYELGKENASRLDAQRARVHETGLPLLYLNQVGGQDGVVYDGHSLALNADLSTAWRAPGWEEQTDLISCRASENGWTLSGAQAAWGDGLAQLYAALTLGTRDYIRKNGFRRVVLGLSGGADSALVAALAADAIGAENVLCVRLPSEFTSSGSMTDAEDLALRLGCELKTVSIAAAAKAVAAEMTRAFGQAPGDLTGQNLQARLRGLYLMGLTNQYPGMLLLTTGNKSEMSVGYATLYGDMSGGFNPLKDVYKTTVFDLMRWRNAHKPSFALGPQGAVIPEAIIAKKPSAELKPGQTDESELGDYATLDAVLRALIEDETPAGQIVAQGFDPAYVAKISGLLDTAEYKRRQAAPGVKVSSRALYGDRRYPITNGFRSARRLDAPFEARLRARECTL